MASSVEERIAAIEAALASPEDDSPLPWQVAEAGWTSISPLLDRCGDRQLALNAMARWMAETQGRLDAGLPPEPPLSEFGEPTEAGRPVVNRLLRECGWDGTRGPYREPVFGAINHD
jgi:hypothetical protein